MANKKKSNKDESRPAITSANKARKSARHDRRAARLVERTQKLIGQRVHYRSKELSRPAVGTVVEVLRKGDEGYPGPYDRRKNPEGSKRKYGAFLKIRTPDGHRVVSRHRVKLVKKEQ